MPYPMVSVHQRRGLKVDVVVAGGGMVGSAAAAAIAQLGQCSGNGDSCVMLAVQVV